MIHILQPGISPAGDDSRFSSPVRVDGNVPVLGAPLAASAGLIINATFDGTITTDPNAAAIENTINTAISTIEAMFSDPITVNITFVKITTGLGQSATYFGNISYATFLAALTGDAKTAEDAIAINSLPSALTNPVNGNTTINVKTANLRAVGIATNVPFDGIVGVNTTLTSPGSVGSPGTYNLLPVILHEIDEVLGLGSALPSPYAGTIFPEDLYRYSAFNARTFTTTDSRTNDTFAFFSIDGSTPLAQFDNQNDGGDFGDWQSNPRSSGVPARVQDAFETPHVNPPLGVELTALDVIGYDRFATTAMTTATIVADRAAPQPLGTTITMTAGGTGGLAPYAFKFLATTNNWATYSILRDWSTTSTVAWTPLTSGSYQVGVWARSSWDSADAPEGAAAIPFSIYLPPMTGVTLSSNRTPPQTTGTPVLFTAAGSGGVAPYSFEFLVSADNWATFSIAQGWSTMSTFSWAPMTPGMYQVGVWARSAGDTTNAPEQAVGVAFAITAQLTIQVQGLGSVTSGDLAIQCPTDACTQAYAADTVVTVHATPTTNNVFAGWSPTGCSSGALVMSADRTCTATFLARSTGAPRAGIVSLSGSGFGDVFTYNAVTGVHTSHYSDGALHFAETNGGWPGGWQVYPADFNDDGLTDFFLYQPVSGQWYKAINDGADDFTYFSGQWSAGLEIFIVDLDGDHHSDAFVSNPTGGWSRCASTGDGTVGFSCASGQWPVALNIYPTDVNGDGLADFLVYSRETGQWSQAINDGVSDFTYRSGTWSAGLTIVPGDFNGDGRGDFFVLNEGTGSWSVVTTLASLDFAYSSDRWSAGWTVTPADFNGDGKTDLFLYNPVLGWWYEAISDGLGGFSYYFGTWGASWQVQATDFNNDGKADLLLYSWASGQWYQAVATGLGTFNYSTGVWDPGLTVFATLPKIP